MTYTDLDPLLTIRDVRQITTLSRATIYRFISAGHFPKPIHLGPNRRAWRLSDVRAWNESPLDWGQDASNDEFFGGAL
jgi:prophage regulatory protein